MTPDEREIIKALGILLVEDFDETIVIILLFAIFVPLGILSLRNSVRTRVHRKAACLVLCGVLSATCMITINLGRMIIYIRFGMIENIGTPIAEKRISTNQRANPWGVASSVFQLVPLLANDALIIWQAWVIFLKRRWALYILAIFWVATAGVMIGSISTVSRFLNAKSLEYVSFGLTLATNILATSFIGYTLWGYWKVFRNVGRESRVWRIVVLLFEIGFLYCLLQAVTVITTILMGVSAPAIQQSSIQTAMQIISNSCIMLSALYPIFVSIVLQGPSVMLGIHTTASSMHEFQFNVNVA